MKNFSTIIKYLFYMALLVVSVSLFSKKISCQKSPLVVDIAEITKVLKDSGFIKPGNVPVSKLDSLQGSLGITPIVSGSWSTTSLTEWPDTISGEINIVTDPTGQPWIGMWVEGRPAHWVRYPQIDWPMEDNSPSDWVGIVEVALIDEAIDWGCGVAWTPLHFWNLNAGIVGTVDLSLFSDSMEWGSAGLYIDRQVSVLRLGSNIGYQFGKGEGVRCGINIGIGLDF